MKKISLFFMLTMAVNFSHSQTTSHGGNHPVNENSENAKWNVYGNAIDANDVFGTTNNLSLNFITNNVSQMILGTDGVLQLKSLAGTSNRILMVDANGNLIIVPASVNTGIMSWDASGGNVILTSGNLGLGTSTPIFKLDVVGDARISNNLYVGGGVVITDKVNAATEVKGFDIKVDNQLTVQGKSSFSDILTANKGIDLGGNNSGIIYAPSSGNGPEVFRLGPLSSPGPSTLPTAPNLCNNPNQMTSITQIPSGLQIYDKGPSGYTGGNILTLQSWFNGSSIDVAGGGGLLMNYFCGKDIVMCTGANGGIIYMGKSVSAQQNVGIGDSYPNPNFDPNVALNISANNNNMDGIRLNIWNGNVKAINLVHPSTGVSNFVIWQSGKTQIGMAKPLTGLHTDAMLSVDGKIVARSLYVTQQNWADFVFNNNYNLPSWEETEAYYKENKHLKNVPTKEEILLEGNNLSETDAILLQKIEEAYLYIGELYKEIENLKKQITK